MQISVPRAHSRVHHCYREVYKLEYFNIGRVGRVLVLAPGRWAAATQVDENVARAESAQSEIETAIGAERGDDNDGRDVHRDSGKGTGKGRQTHKVEVSAKNKHKMSWGIK